VFQAPGNSIHRFRAFPLWKNDVFACGAGLALLLVLLVNDSEYSQSARQ
jgi:hypothetical protein